MSAIQKQAAFNLVVVSIIFAMFAAAVPVVGVAWATNILGLLVFLGLGLLFYRRRGAGDVVVDERDKAIEQRANMIGIGVFWLLFVSACVGGYLFYGADGAIPVRILPVVMFCAWGLWELTRAIAILLQYRDRGVTA